jgi:ribosome biogenesis protein MAK21
MKAIVIESISDVIFRSGSDYHARYYSAITLNQTILAHKDVEVANTLMKVYLNLFERLLSEWNNEKQVEESKAKPAKKPRWKNKGNKGKKGGIRQEEKSATTVKEEENAKLSSAILTGLNRAFPFSDLPKSIFDKHIDTLYQVTHSANFNTSLQALILIHQISRSQGTLIDRYYRTLYESLLDPRLATSSKLRLYLNLLFKSLKEDTNAERSKAFTKRIVQMAANWLSIGIVSAAIFLVMELEKSVPALRSLLTGERSLPEGESGEYDGRKRDPVYAHAGNSQLWELVPLLHHFHPTVEHYASGYLDNETGFSKPDVDLHTLTHFLDRFVYKNPKQKPAAKGGSIMQPLSGADPRGLLNSSKTDRAPVNLADWSKMNVEDVEVGDRFFYDYFTKRTETKPKKEKSAGGEEGDELDEDEVWKALVESRPDLEGEGEDDLSGFSDEDLSDLDMDDEDEGSDDAEGDDDGEGESDEEEFQDFDDREGLVGSDDEIDFPDDYDESSEEEEEAVPSKGAKRAAQSEGQKKSKRQKLKDLPEFGSVEDYAQYLGSSDEDFS